MSITHAKDLEASERDFMPLNGIDHVELWVGNAAQASYYFQRAWTKLTDTEDGARLGIAAMPP